MRPRNWLDLAKNDIRFCKVMEEKLPEEYAKAGTCFHTQQAVEKLLKGLLLTTDRAPQCTDIYNLAEMCEVYVKADMPAELIEIANTLTEWRDTLAMPKFDKSIYDTAKAVIAKLTKVLENEIKCTETMVDKLEYVIGCEYAEMYRKWLDISAEELIEQSDKISAARFVNEHIRESFTEKEAEYLLELKAPLAILVHKIPALNDADNTAAQEEFSDMVTAMYDRQDEYELVDDEGMRMK